MKEQSLFIEALEKEDHAEREAFLRAACAENDELRQRVERLLQLHEEPGDPLGPPATAAWASIDTMELDRPGMAVGPYKLVEVIGEGGMGVVYLAEQQEPIRRTVAVKIIKPGMDSKQVIARFAVERQALALMDHPNIARVLDAGTTEAGKPYFVMELVKGVPITRYCDDNRLTTRQRLGLFLQVCSAVQHAHQKGIIHRDLKPSNILVAPHDGTPLVKVIDFGVAKATGEQLTEQTVYTTLAQIVGTPLYMSPEQAGRSNLDIDTRSDIYSLGVLLYELLTGTTPFAAEVLRQVGHDEMRRMIREDEPPRPSVRLSTVEKDALVTLAERLGVEPRRLHHELQGELDWVVMKCLEKDRNRRYETANSLAREIERYLADEPVEARSPTLGYRLRKVLLRNRGTVLAAVLILLALVGGVIGTSLGMLQAERRRVQAKEEQDRAVAAEADTAAFADFLARHILAATRPEGMQAGVGINVTMAEALEKAELTMEKVFEQVLARKKEHRLGELILLITRRNLARVYFAMKQPKKAMPLMREILAQQTIQLGTGHPGLATAQASVALDLLQADQPAEAEPLLRECLATRVATMPDAWLTFHARSMLGGALLAQKKFVEAESLLLQGYQGMKDRAGTNPPSFRPVRLRAVIDLVMGCALLGQKEPAETEPVLLEDGESIIDRRGRVPPFLPARLKDAIERLVQFNEATGRKDEAARWRQRLAEHRAQNLR